MACRRPVRDLAVQDINLQLLPEAMLYVSHNISVRGIILDLYMSNFTFGVPQRRSS